MKKIKIVITKRNIIDNLSLLVVFWTLLLLLIYGVATLYPYEIVKFKKEDGLGRGLYIVEDKVIKEGELLRYHVQFEKLSDRQGVMSCFFEDGILFRTPSTLSNQPVGVRDYIQAVEIPQTLPSGEYKYGCLVSYEMYFDKVITYTFYTDEFTVEKQNT